MATKKEPEVIPEPEPIQELEPVPVLAPVEAEPIAEETTHKAKSPQFNWKKYVIRVQGGREYLTAAARLRWFRDEHPDWSINTDILSIDTSGVLMKATVSDASGFPIATGIKQVNKTKDAENYISKAETGAVNRAITFCGYGLPDEDEMSEDLSMAVGGPAAPQANQAPPVQGNRYRSYDDPNQPPKVRREGWQ